MYIKSVNLISFGKFVSKEIEFKNEICVIFGSNEAGKTTIVDAIAGVLFGFKGRREELKRLKNRYVPREEGRPYKAGITVVIKELGSLYIERDFLSNKAEVYTINEAGKSLAGISTEDILRNYLGITDLQLFKSTMLIRQEEIATLAREEISNALSKKIINSEHTTSMRAVFKSLGKRYLELNRGLIRSTGSNGPIRTCLNEINRLETELKAMEGLSGDYEALLDEAEALEENIFGQKSRLNELSPMLANYRKYSELKKNRDKLFDRQNDIQTRLDNAGRKLTELKKIEQYLQEKAAFEPYLTDAALARVNSLEKEIDRLNEKVDFNCKNMEQFKTLKEQLQNDLGKEPPERDTIASDKFSLDNLMEAERLSGQILELNRQLGTRQAGGTEELFENKNAGRRSLLPAIGLLLCLMSVFGILAKNIQGYVAASLLLLTGLTIVVLGKAGRKSGAATNYNKVLEEESERIRGTIDGYRKVLANLTGNLSMDEFRIKVNSCEESKKRVFAINKQLAEIDVEKYREESVFLNNELNRAGTELRILLGHTGVNAPEEYRQLHQACREIRKQWETLKDSVSDYLGDLDEKELRKEMSVLSVKIHNIQTEMDAVRCTVLPEEYEVLAEEERTVQGRLEILEKELIRVKTGVSDYERFALKDKDRWTVENSLLEKKAELKTLEIKKKGILETVKILREAVGEAQVDMVPHVVARASQIVTEITDGKYEGLDLILDTTGITVTTPVDKGLRKVNASDLSAGTRDQVYLALRVAVAEFFTGALRCPLIFDDPFVNFDTERLNNTIALLNKAAQEHQVIILTKDPQYLQQGADSVSRLTV